MFGLFGLFAGDPFAGFASLCDINPIGGHDNLYHSPLPAAIRSAAALVRLFCPLPNL